MADTVWETLLSYGPGALGFVLLYLLVARGDLRTRWEVQALERQITKAEAQVDTMNTTLRELATQNQRTLDTIEAVLVAVQQEDRRGTRR